MTPTQTLRVLKKKARVLSLDLGSIFLERFPSLINVEYTGSCWDRHRQPANKLYFFLYNQVHWTKKIKCHNISGSTKFICNEFTLIRHLFEKLYMGEKEGGCLLWLITSIVYVKKVIARPEKKNSLIFIWCDVFFPVLKGKCKR